MDEEDDGQNGPFLCLGEGEAKLIGAVIFSYLDPVVFIVSWRGLLIEWACRGILVVVELSLGVRRGFGGSTGNASCSARLRQLAVVRREVGSVGGHCYERDAGNRLRIGFDNDSEKKLRDGGKRNSGVEGR